MFDCVLATRLGRHGTILTGAGRLNLRNAAHVRSDLARSTSRAPARCAGAGRGPTCATCCTVQEPTAARLLTIHNLHWCLTLMEQATSGHPGRAVRGPPGRDPVDLDVT